MGGAIAFKMPPMQSILEKAKTYLDDRRGERVTLEELAGAVGASPFHLQRRFKEAFGISPRDYQDAYRVESVKSSLQNGSRVTDALFEAGYGSVSRFYEKPRLGMQARQYRARGKGQSIAYCCFPTPLGTVLIAATERGLCSVKMGSDEKALKKMLAREFGEAELVEEALPALKKEIIEFLRGDANLAKVPLDIRGTVFQRKVWDELRRIPRGETRTYSQIARAIGTPDAVRAVGSACGANPLALVVPCHRAVRTDGGLGGYAWGLPRKKKLLALEKK
jgi:AraC family transcriptional regulator, regulatory protein of adaptative response / methylated-DNA-[protein]-cysteine methyltransferase